MFRWYGNNNNGNSAAQSFGETAGTSTSSQKLNLEIFYRPQKRQKILLYHLRSELWDDST